MLKVRFVSQAILEIEGAASWYEEQRKGLGSAFLLSVEDTVSRAKCYPESFPLVDTETRRALTKRFPYGIFYRVDGDTLVVYY